MPQTLHTHRTATNSAQQNAVNGKGIAGRNSRQSAYRHDSQYSNSAAAVTSNGIMVGSTNRQQRHVVQQDVRRIAEKYRGSEESSRCSAGALKNDVPAMKRVQPPPASAAAVWQAAWQRVARPEEEQCRMVAGSSSATTNAVFRQAVAAGSAAVAARGTAARQRHSEMQNAAGRYAGYSLMQGSKVEQAEQTMAGGSFGIIHNRKKSTLQ